MKRAILSFFLFGTVLSAMAQTPDGQLDLQDLTTVHTEEFLMPDGTKLMTDIYLPIMQDCLMVPIDTEFDLPSQLSIIPGIPSTIPIDLDLELIPRGTQYLIYDSLWVNGVGQKNPNPYQLPLVFTRTPYDKGDQDAEEAPVMSLLGYAFAKQDMRGRYTSEGVYFPLTSDSYNKNAYHPNYKHILDKSEFDAPNNGNRHEDGYHSLEYIKNSLTRDYNGISGGEFDTTELLYNGRIAMFGASALGYNQYQAAAAHRINPDEPGLKAILPIVAPGDFYKGVGFPNGVMRDRLVTGWLKGQIFSGTDDDLIGIDGGIYDNIHSSVDYDLPKDFEVNGVVKAFQKNKFDAANLAIDHFLLVRYDDEDGGQLPAGYYPNSPGRKDMDISRAFVDENGESVKRGKIVTNGGTTRVVDVPDSDPDGIIGFGNTPRPNLTKNRYSNMDVPGYHLVGWWDIFIDSQVETWTNMKSKIPKAHGNHKLQKLVIGPWAHQTIGQQVTGDRRYPENVNDLLGLDFDEFSNDNIPIAKAINSEVIGWFRYHLNYTPEQYIGEPKFVLPESENLVEVLDLGFAGTLSLRVPSEEILVPFDELLGIFNGSRDLDGIKGELVYDGPIPGIDPISIDLPAISVGALIAGLDDGDITAIPYRDFTDETVAPNVRLYVVGPNNDTLNPQNVGLSNYWLGVDTFPLPEGHDWDAIQRETFYMHKNGGLDNVAPVEDEGFKMYVHDPDDPIRTIGGANMIVSTPDGERDSQGQFNIKDERYASHTVDRPGVVSFTQSVPVGDSLCVVGIPHVKLYAKSNIGGLSSGPTDTDFMVRIIDVYPDGREYFVQGGAVNARARTYAKMLVEHPEKDQNYPFVGDDIPFTNIEIGEVVEYVFQLLPIAYTFGDGHKIKILVSSSNYTRFQVNPNVPINDGEFFRRKPGDGKKYIFDGVEMAPRVAIQRIHFSEEHPSQITLPIYTKEYIGVEEIADESSVTEMLVYPNPAISETTVFTSNDEEYDLNIRSLDGALISNEGIFSDNITIDVSQLSAGLYFIEMTNTETKERTVQKLTKM